MLLRPARNCYLLHKSLSSSVNKSRLIFNPVSLNSQRFLSVTSIKFSEKPSKSDLEVLFEYAESKPKATSVSEELSANTSVDNAIEHVDIDKSVFTEGADSILSSTPVDVSSAVLEPSFSSLGLGHGWPSGWLQSLLEVLHAGAGLEWWQAIGITTVCLRIVIFPIMIIAQKSIVQQNKHLVIFCEHQNSIINYIIISACDARFTSKGSNGLHSRKP